MSFEFLLPLVLGIFAVLLTLKSAWEWRGGKYLCEDCRFNNFNDCKKNERPKAIICFSYRQGQER